MQDHIADAGNMVATPSHRCEQASADYPHGTRVRKISGPQWEGVVVGHYSSSFTPDGLVIECTVEGARGQVHVEPAKRMEIVPA